MQSLRPGPFRGEIAGKGLNAENNPIVATQSSTIGLDSVPIRLQAGRADVFLNLLMTTLVAATTVVTREPLYTPERPILTRHEEPIQNLQQTTLKASSFVNVDLGRPLAIRAERSDPIGTNLQLFQSVIATTPFVNYEFGRAQRLTGERIDPTGTNYQLFLVPPATDPAINVWYSRPIRLATVKDGEGSTNLLLFPPQVVSVPVVNYDFGRPATLPARHGDIQAINSLFASPISNFDYSIPQRFGTNRQDEVGLNIQLFTPPVTNPFTQPDLGARAQFNYSRVDGPLGQPLLIAFPLAPSVLPFNIFDVGGRAQQFVARNQEGQGVNLQLFPPSINPVPTQEQFSGGWPYFYDYTYERSVRKRKLEEARRAEEEIEEEIDHNIARLLHQQQEKDEEREDLERIRLLVRQHKEVAPVDISSERVLQAIDEVKRKENRASLEKLQREFERMIYEEEQALIIFLNDYLS